MTQRQQDTRERILDVALELFNRQGYDRTSLREIAEQLEVTKAALYYHFKSKDAILWALHQRLHSLLDDLSKSAAEGSLDVITWREMLKTMIHRAQANRDLITLHERNRSAFERIHESDSDHDSSHDDIESSFKQMLGNDQVPIRTRVRFSAALGTIIGMVAMQNASKDLSAEDQERYFGEVIDELLPDDLLLEVSSGPPAAPPPPP